MQRITSQEQFKEVISQDNKSIVKFFADWCPDCRRMDMFIDEIMQDYAQYGWYEINTDEFPEIARENEVMGVPSLLLYEKGKKTTHLHSKFAKTPEQVREFLDNLNN